MPPRRSPLKPIYSDKSDKERVTGPIEYAIDGDELTAWTTDVGYGRSNQDRTAVFVLAGADRVVRAGLRSRLPDAKTWRLEQR